MLTTLLLFALAPQPGNLAGAPATVFVDSHTAAANGLTTYRPYYKLAGTHTTAPIDHPSGAVDGPDFYNAPFIQPGLEIDAFSTNLNWISSTDTGLAWAQEDGGTAWAGIVWSVSRDTLGAPGSTIAHARAGGHHAGDLFSYLYPDSLGVPPSLVDHTMLPVDDMDMRLVGDLAQPVPSVAAMDLFVPMLIGGPNTFGQIIGQFTGVVFSVTTATAGAINPQWLLTPNGPVPSSGALIFYCPWSAGAGWGRPRPFLLPSRLGIGVGDDVTALAWDAQPHHQRLLFASTASPDPIMFLSLKSASSQPVTFRIKQTLEPVSKRAGFEEVGGSVVGTTQALCGLDPRVWNYDQLAADLLPVSNPAAQATLWHHVGPKNNEDRLVACIMPQTAAAGMPSASGAVLWECVGGGAPVAIGVIRELFENQLAQLSWPVPSSFLEPIGHFYAFTVHDKDGALLGTTDVLAMTR